MIIYDNDLHKLKQWAKFFKKYEYLRPLLNSTGTNWERFSLCHDLRAME